MAPSGVFDALSCEFFMTPGRKKYRNERSRDTQNMRKIGASAQFRAD